MNYPIIPDSVRDLMNAKTMPDPSIANSYRTAEATEQIAENTEKLNSQISVLTIDLDNERSERKNADKTTTVIAIVGLAISTISVVIAVIALLG